MLFSVFTFHRSIKARNCAFLFFTTGPKFICPPLHVLRSHLSPIVTTTTGKPSNEVCAAGHLLHSESPDGTITIPPKSRISYVLKQSFPHRQSFELEKTCFKSWPLLTCFFFVRSSHGLAFSPSPLRYRQR